MTDLPDLKGCELHCHLGGCIYAEDLLELGKDVYREVDWNLFVNGYEKAFARRPDPVALFEDAIAGRPGGLSRFRRHYIVEEEDSASFARFQAKFNLNICLFRHWRQVLHRETEIVRRIVERHRAEGLDYVEYRAMYSFVCEDPEGFISFHRRNARVMQEASRNGFEARYIISLPRWAPLEGYALLERLFDESPDVIPTIVGLDFCFFEEGYPPKTLRPLFELLERDNRLHPERALQVVYHVGEVYFDKSLESAVRWCHEAAEMGASRLGHAIALGLDPETALARRREAHQEELASERVDQIAYDLRYSDALQSYGVNIDRPALERERSALRQCPAAARVRRTYTRERLEEIRHRQDFVLDRLAELGTVIESCPTSNLRIGGVPEASRHPLHRFLDSTVKLAIGADDPGIFDSPLAAEVDWVVENTGMDADALVLRLEDPRRFRLGNLRTQQERRETGRD